MDPWDILLDDQFGVVHRRQALASGMTENEIRHRVRRDTWRVVYPGVYATFTGQIPFPARVWAALLHAGPPAMASHATAARLQGLLDEDPAVVQMSVPNHHRVTPQRGFRVHRPRAWADRRQPASTLPVTRVEDTVLDLVGTTRDRTRSCTGSFAPASAGSPRRPGSVPPLAVDVGSDTGRWFRSW